MEKFTAVCGLNCAECEAYIATKNNDNILRKNLSEKWSKLYNHEFKTEDINCDGCIADGKHIGYCFICEVRKCGLSKKIKSCALCTVYPDCNTLNGFLKIVPEEGAKKIKSNLEFIKPGKMV